LSNRKSKPAGNYAFIDSQNLNLGVQKVGWKMDWKKLREHLSKEYNVTTAYLFIGYMVENESMYEQLHESGYLIVLKPTVNTNETPQTPVISRPEQSPKVSTSTEEQTDTVRRPVKGNVDAELVLYALKELPNYKKAIIVSGDGDFYCLAEYLAEKKRLLKIMTPNWQYSSLLKPYESYIVRIDKLKKELEHRDYRRKPKGARNNHERTAKN